MDGDADEVEPKRGALWNPGRNQEVPHKEPVEGTQEPSHRGHALQEEEAAQPRKDS